MEIEKKYLIELKKCKQKDISSAEQFLQSGFWGQFKECFAWKAHHFLTVWDSGVTTPLLVITRNLALGFGFAYIPWGPQLPLSISGDEQKTKAMEELARELKKHLPYNIAFVRFDPPWYNTNDSRPKIFAPFTHSACDIQPPDTVILDISPGFDDILAQMKPKWRYNIRLGCKKVTIRNAGKQELEKYYSLLSETATRDGISIHAIEYYLKLFECAEKFKEEKIIVNLYLAAFEDKDIAGIITLFRGKTATYLYGASSNSYRNVMAPYALQWRAIEDAKKAFCTEYDFFGIPPDDSPDHPMAGLYRFKTGFGGKIIHRSGSWDYAYIPIIQKVFNTAEYLRKKIRDKKKFIKTQK